MFSHSHCHFFSSAGLSKLIISVGNSRGRWSETVMSKYVEYRDSIASPVSAFYGTKLMTNKLQLYLAYDHRSCYAWSKFPTFRTLS